MANTSVTVRMDEELKKQTEMLLSDMGLNMTTAFTLLAKAIVREGRIPFEIKVDPFYNEANLAHLRKAIKKYEETGVAVHKTMAELLAMENDE